MTDLFAPYVLGLMRLRNRFVMAPMTRLRADDAGSPTEDVGAYYAQRAAAGLIITEGIAPSRLGRVAPNAPGLYTDEQTRAWAAVVRRVHQRGGLIVAQLMHAGRITHSSTAGELPVAPSAVTPAGTVLTSHGWTAFEQPRELKRRQIPEVVASFVTAARNAMTAGFDAVEIHSANGWLLHQFLADGVNQRTDDYGGYPANRARLTIEATTAVADEVGWHRVGLRISPGNRYNDIVEQDAEAAYIEVLHGLRARPLYLHLLDQEGQGWPRRLRPHWQGVLIADSGTNVESTLPELRRRASEVPADLVSVGRKFLANPDLVARYAKGQPLNPADEATFYVGGSAGYTDYPAR